MHVVPKICIHLHTDSAYTPIACVLSAPYNQNTIEELLPDFALHASAMGTDLVYDLSGTAHADMPLQTYLCKFTSAVMQV